MNVIKSKKTNLVVMLVVWTALSYTGILESKARAQVAGMPRPPAIPASDPDYQAGYLNVNLYNGIDGLVVDPTGNLDSTAGLQRAINDCIQYGLTVYVPSGTYLVSNTLYGEQPNSITDSACEDHI